MSPEKKFRFFKIHQDKIEKSAKLLLLFDILRRGNAADRATINSTKILYVLQLGQDLYKFCPDTHKKKFYTDKNKNFKAHFAFKE